MNIEKQKRGRKPMSDETKELLKQKREEKRQEKLNIKRGLKNNVENQKTETIPMETTNQSINHVKPESTTLSNDNKISLSRLEKLDNIENILLQNNRELQELKLLKQQKNKIKEQKQKLKELKNKTVDKEETKVINSNIMDVSNDFNNIDYSILFR